jgi:nucleotide-binding universal stress UspA family protein
MMKTIVVPFDFSDESFNGLNMAMKIDEKTKGNIMLVHVIEKFGGDYTKHAENESELAQTKFKEIIRKNSENNKSGHILSYVIRKGKTFKEIADLSDDFEDSLVVLSTHGASGFEELFIGGNAYKITSHSRRPVISIRRNKIPSDISNIVLPLDMTFQTREKVPYTVEFAKKFDSRIHILTIRLSNLKSIEKRLLQYADQVISYLESHAIPYTLEHLQGKNLTDLTLDYARSIEADMISIMTEQEKSASNLLLGNFAHQMINKSDIPVLSFPNYHLRITAEDIWTLGAFNP